MPEPQDSSAVSSNEITAADLQGATFTEQPASVDIADRDPATRSSDITAADLSTDKPPEVATQEAPAADKPAETPAENQPAPPANTPVPFDPAAVLTGDDADKAVAHLAGGKFKTAAELTAALSDLPTDAERALLAHLRSGAKMSDVSAVLDTDWDTASDLDVHRAAWDKANPQYTDPELRDFAWDKHVMAQFANALSEDDTDAAVKYDKLQLKTLANADRAAFKAEQDKYRAMPSASADAATQAAEQAKQREAEAASAKAYYDAADAAIQDFKTLAFEFDTPTGKQTATLELGDLSDEDRVDAKEPILYFLKKWEGKDGSIDPRKAMADVLRDKRSQALTALAVEQGRVAERTDQFERLQNRSYNPNRQATGGRTLMEELAAATSSTVGPSRN